MPNAQQKCTLKKKEKEEGVGGVIGKRGKMEKGGHEEKNNQRREMKERRYSDEIIYEHTGYKNYTIIKYKY